MPASDVMVIISYRAQPGREAQAVRELGDLIATVVREERDCHGIQLYQDEADPTRLLLHELWTSQAAYTGPHLQTPHLKAFIARAPGFLAGPPDITFWSLRSDARPAGA